MKDIAELVEKAGRAVCDVICLSGEKDGVKAEIAMVYTDSCSWNCRSYVNNFETRCGGSHCDGFRAGLADVYNKFLKDRLEQDSEQIKINGDDDAEGLCAIIKVSVPEFNYDLHVEPEYKDQVVFKKVKAIAKKEFGKYLEENPAFAKDFSNNALLCARARLAAERARKEIRRH
jgi:DNA gyrase subunit B